MTKIEYKNLGREEVTLVFKGKKVDINVVLNRKQWNELKNVISNVDIYRSSMI